MWIWQVVRQDFTEEWTVSKRSMENRANGGSKLPKKSRTVVTNLVNAKHGVALETIS